ncbi:MAG: hypothetical protein MJ171_07670 [Clostridia bacterium]|nr:hypothetical protein [Clostridia bacterium]
MKRKKKSILNKQGMELVQVAILVAIAIALGLIFKDRITDFVSDIFDNLDSTGFLL